MSSACDSYIDALQSAADEAGRRETEYRREAAERIAALERERSFAYRRLNLMRAISECASAEDETAAVAQAEELLRNKLGWAGDSDMRTAVVTSFAPVAVAVYGGGDPEPIAAALSSFESWYEGTYATPFWLLFEQYMPETPLVDF